MGNYWDISNGNPYCNGDRYGVEDIVGSVWKWTMGSPNEHVNKDNYDKSPMLSDTVPYFQTKPCTKCRVVWNGDDPYRQEPCNKKRVLVAQDYIHTLARSHACRIRGTPGKSSDMFVHQFIFMYWLFRCIILDIYLILMYWLWPHGFSLDSVDRPMMPWAQQNPGNWFTAARGKAIIRGWTNRPSRSPPRISPAASKASKFLVYGKSPGLPSGYVKIAIENGYL